MAKILNRDVVLNENILLSDGDDSVEFEGKHGLKMLVTFKGDGTGKPSISPDFHNGVFRLPLANFGSPLGMAVSGKMTAQTVAAHPRPGSWQLKYSLAVHLIGDDFRSVHLTVTEERVA